MNNNKTVKGLLAWLLLLAGLVPAMVMAQGEPAGLDAKINQAVSPAADWITSKIFYSVPVLGADIKLIVVWLLLGALFFTFYLKFINFRGFAHAFNLVRGKYDAGSNGPGEVSHFQALATALSGTVGLGNIGGVAVAVSIGGPGATFWMILAGLLGMSSKFAECTLGVKYRRELPDGSVSGGPMYYLRDGLAERGWAGLGKVLAVVFAICCIGGSIGGGNMYQANQAFKMVVNSTGGEASVLAGQGWLFGLIVAIVVAVVIIGGIKSIARVTSKLVPFMALIYVVAALVIILGHYDQVPAAFGQIFAGAFSPEGVKGGVLGVLIIGFQRAAFSNEAGVGSASIAHSAVRTKDPATEGFVSLLEPFIDTVVICTMTALVIIITGSHLDQSGIQGVELTAGAFASVLPWFTLILTLAVVLFAFSTMLSWAYYGAKSWTYLVGESRAMDVGYKLMFCGFIVIGATMDLGSVIGFSDAMIFAMSLPNVIGLYLLAPILKREVDDYWTRFKTGQVAVAD